ncbi:DNA polymerase III subunit gamma/tau [Salinicola rhizosphaerae]|uniref:DNA polymerase III subunit gamma/tau n=1 Tax=Salinicola rhizosphaerae TaxID=1443141 RepID=A0ABQ3EDY9_9GAMM|nr:DNA polymerase III subunit gamma/tau [Salinicola rhizosphaerae]GHB29419.1 DNA polymerase III subunit gamma/tau [Salinicola rhizosphaerae]
MSYQVLARKWRPRNFHELVGQEHVSRALVNALDQGRLHHAYLFTGTRGVGKTTLARILAKCLNCEQGVTSTPCGQCETCQAIDNGRFVDLIEVDAASRTKVEDTRELLDNVQYAPTQGRFKVYLIDEVHMLSTHSFNALLKTLEEPPPHVKFLLATTDPQKLPVTVLSRCLQFTLKNMAPERVVEHLTHVLEAEQVAFDPQALWLLGKAADGSMRDAMSLTDQAIAFGQGEIRREDVAAMLGTLDHAHLIALAEALAAVDAERLLAEVASLAEQGPDFAGILDELSGLMHRLAIAQMVPNALDNGHGDRDELLALASRFTPEDVQLYYQIALQGRGDIDSAPDTRTALEMTLLRMLAFRPQGVPTPPQTDLPLRGEQATAPAQAAPTGGPASAQPPASDRTQAPATETQPTRQPESTAAPQGTAAPEAPSPVADEAPPWREEAAEVGSTSVETSTSAPQPAGEALAAASPAANPNSVDAPEAPPWAVESPEPPMPSQAADAEAAAPASEPGASDAVIEEEGDIESGADLAAAEAAYADWATAAAPALESVPEAAPQSAPVADMDDAGPSNEVNSAAAPDSANEMTTPVAQGELTHALWLEHFDTLAIGGLTRNLAAHCVVESDDGATLALTLDPGQSAILSEMHVDRIVKALSALGYSRRVNITVAELDGALETPKAKRDREARERHARAVEALRDDPHVQEMETRFGARLMEESVTADRL